MPARPAAAPGPDAPPPERSVPLTQVIAAADTHVLVLERGVALGASTEKAARVKRVRSFSRTLSSFSPSKAAKVHTPAHTLAPPIPNPAHRPTPHPPPRARARPASSLCTLPVATFITTAAPTRAGTSTAATLSTATLSTAVTAILVTTFAAGTQVATAAQESRRQLHADRVSRRATPRTATSSLVTSRLPLLPNLPNLPNLSEFQEAKHRKGGELLTEAR